MATVVSPDILVALSAIRKSRNALNIDLNSIDNVLRTDPSLTIETQDLLLKVVDSMKYLADSVADVLASSDFRKRNEDGDV
jgi:hypothetical protein